MRGEGASIMIGATGTLGGAWSEWSWTAALWECLWIVVGLVLGFFVAYHFADRVLAHAAEQQRLVEWHHVGRAARGKIRNITIQIVTNCMVRGLPIRGPSLGRDAFQAWADGIRAILLRRPDPTQPLSVVQLKTDEDARVIVLLQNVAPVLKHFLPRLIGYANLFRDAFPEDLRRAISLACLEVDDMVTVTKPLSSKMTEEQAGVQLTQNADAGLKAFEALAEPRTGARS